MRRRLVTALAVVGGVLLMAPAAALASGTVYVSTNAAGANAVRMFDQGPGGALTPAGSIGTGGAGTGAGLGTQGAVTLSADGRWLLVVNAGSDNLTLFRVGDDGSLTRRQVVDSHGDGPVSVTKWGSLVYVVHT